MSSPTNAEVSSTGAGPSAIVIRRAGPEDAPILSAMRVASHLERHPDEDPVALKRFAGACEAFFTTELGAASSFLTAWIAWDSADHDRPVGTATLTVLPTLPRLGENGGPLLDARVRNVYVMPFARRLGVARALMLALVSDVADHGIRRLTLGSSVMARPLYEGMGFTAKTDEMVIDLRRRVNAELEAAQTIPAPGTLSS